MKVLHYSDQGAKNFPEIYKEADVLVTTGDLAMWDFFGLEDLSVRKPAFGVYGNHDTGNYLEQLGITNLHMRVVEFGGLRWGGFQGCLRYKTGETMFDEEQAKDFAKTFPYVDVLLLHAGPKDMLDDPSDEVHVGSENIKQYVLDKKPKVVFCGHQYSDAFLDLGETKIFRSFGARIIKIEAAEKE